MASYILAKCAVTYMGSSGPGTSRSLKVHQDPITLMICEDLSIQKPYKENLKSPVENPVTLSQQAVTAVDAYLHSYKILEIAKMQFEEAKKKFAASTGGKEVLKLLCPETGPLPVEQVVSKEDMNALQALVEETIGPDNKVITCSACVSGYDIGTVTLKLEKPILLTTVENLKYNEYFWSKYCYNTQSIQFATEKSTRVRFVKKGHQYPPYRNEDCKEVTEAEQRILDRYKSQ
jgi:hypothetical protein